MHTLFQDRQEAGRRIAKKLENWHDSGAVILAIPRGGVPVAATAAHRLQLPWGIVLVRKLPIPWNPEAGFGAVASDGSLVLNESMVQGMMMKRSQVDEVAESVRRQLTERAEFLESRRPAIDPTGKTIVLIDDGLASGYTMLAAIKSARQRGAAKVIAAAPVASRSAAAMVEDAADECVFDILSPAVPFAVADFYLDWRDLTDEDLVPWLDGSKPGPARVSSA